MVTPGAGVFAGYTSSHWIETCTKSEIRAHISKQLLKSEGRFGCRSKHKSYLFHKIYHILCRCLVNK